jgi:hypothetical protein
MYDFLVEPVGLSLPFFVWGLLAYMGLAGLVSGVVLLAITSQVSAQQKQALKALKLSQGENERLRLRLAQGERKPLPVEQLVIAEEVQ